MTNLFARLISILFVTVFCHSAMASITSPTGDSDNGSYRLAWTYTAESSCYSGDTNKKYYITEQKSGSTTVSKFYTNNTYLDFTNKSKGSYVYRVHTYLCASTGNAYYYRSSKTVEVLGSVPQTPPWSSVQQTGSDTLTITYAKISDVDTIQLYESENGSSMRLVDDCNAYWECQSVNSSSNRFTRKVDTGRYRYQIRGVNSAGAGGFTTTNEVTIVVAGSETPIVPSLDKTVTDPENDSLSGDVYTGLLHGTHSVSNSGAFSYEIPIEVPMGINGVQPDLALVYNSANTGNGVLGWGWGLKGNSGITRCGADLVRDGYKSGILPGDDYKFCFDGKRLVEVADREYRTEYETFARIKSSGGTERNPSIWTVEFKNGRKATYGNSSTYLTDSEGNRRYWAINQLQDVFGNKMVYTYSKGGMSLDDGSYAAYMRLTEIKYAYDDNNSPTHRVYFSYQSRPDEQFKYVAGKLIAQTHRINAISTYVNNVKKYQYNIKYIDNSAYENDLRQLSRVELVEKCARFDGVNFECGPAKKIIWNQSNDKPGFSGVTPSKYYGSGDIDGDGGLETITVSKTQDSQGDLYRIYVKNISDSGNGALWLSTREPIYRRPEIYDFNGDGYADVVFGPNGFDDFAERNITYLRSTGYSFIHEDMGRPLSEIQSQFGLSSKRSMLLIDVTGDGLKDILFYSSHSNVGLKVKRNNGAGFDDWESWFSNSNSNIHEDSKRWKFADFNGDGLTDFYTGKIIGSGSNAKLSILLNTGVGFQYAEWSAEGIAYNDSAIFKNGAWHVAGWAIWGADVNGDGLDDFVTADGDSSTGRYFSVLLSTGAGFTKSEVALSTQGSAQQFYFEYMQLDGSIASAKNDSTYYVKVLDLDNDGCADIFTPYISSDGWVRSVVSFSNCGKTNQYSILKQWDSNTVVSSVGYLESEEDSILYDSGDLYFPRYSMMDFDMDGALEVNYADYRFETKQQVRKVEKIEDYEVTAEASGSYNQSKILEVDYALAHEYATSGTRQALTAYPVKKVNFTPFGYVVKDINIKSYSGRERYSSSVAATSSQNTNYQYINYFSNPGGWGELGYEQLSKKVTTGDSNEFTKEVTQYYQKASTDYSASGWVKENKVYVGAGSESGRLVNWVKNKIKLNRLRDDIDYPNENGYSPHYFAYKYKVTTEKYDVNSGSLYSTTEQKAFSGDGCTTCSDLFTSIGFSEYTQYGSLKTLETVVKDVGSKYPIITTTVSKGSFDDKTTSSNWVLDLPGVVTNKVDLGVAGYQTRSNSYTYDSNGQLRTKTPNIPETHLDSVTTYSYNEYGTRDSELISWTRTSNDGLNFGTSREISKFESRVAGGNIVIQNIDASGEISTIEVDPYNGKEVRIVDVNDNVVTNTYDALSRVVSSSASNNVSTVTHYRQCDSCFNYNTSAEWYSSTKTNGGTAERVYYDMYDRVVGTRSRDLKGRYIYSYRNYDDRGRLTVESMPFYEGDSVQKTLYDYDLLDRKTIVTYVDSSKDNYTYNGNWVHINNRENQDSSKYTNGLGWLLETKDNLDTKVEFEYWPLGDLKTTKVDGRNDSKILVYYDSMGNKTRLVDPAMGEINYKYNPLGLLSTETDANDFVTRYEYDKLNRQVKRTDDALGDSPKVQNWVYDNKAHGMGMLGSINGKDSDGDTYKEEFEYNSDGQVRKHVKEIKGKRYTSTYHYDDYGRSLGLTYPSGITTKSKYNSYGFQHQVILHGSNKVLWEAQDMDEFGNITQNKYGNNVINYKIFNNQGRLETVRAVTYNGQTLQNTRAYYTPLGNLDNVFDYRTYENKDYCYDDLNRLEECSDLTRNEYDDLGNIQTKGGKDYTYTSGKPHAVRTDGSNNTYYYDDAGQMTSGAGRTIEYTSFGKPNYISKTVGSTKHEVLLTYGSGQSRVQQYVPNTNTTLTYVDLGNYEISQTGNSIKRVHYIGGFAQLVQETTVGTSVTEEEYVVYLHRDQQGSVVVETGEVANSTSSAKLFEFDAWGSPQSALSDVTSRGYTDHEHLESVGLIHMNGRVFDPELARFLTPDPLIQAPHFSQSYNRYSYVFNNPSSFIDPNGYEAITVAGQVNAPAVMSLLKISGSNGLSVQGLQFSLTGTFPGYSNTGEWGFGGSIDFVVGAEFGTEGAFTGKKQSFGVTAKKFFKSLFKISAVGTATFNWEKKDVSDVQNSTGDVTNGWHFLFVGAAQQVNEDGDVSGYELSLGPGLNWGITFDEPVLGFAVEEDGVYLTGEIGD